MANVLGQALIKAGRHLPELHGGDFHLVQRGGDLLDGAQLEGGVGLLLAFGRGNDPSCPHGSGSTTNQPLPVGSAVEPDPGIGQ